MLTHQPALIAVDWGTTNFRAFLLNHQGQSLAACQANTGIAGLSGAFADILHQHLEPWLSLHPGLPVLLCGMIGSRQGWFETEYVSCPFDAPALASGLVQVHTFNQGNCWILPGAQCQTQAGYVDVMRGEETQLLGAMQLLSQPVDALCMPGTHNKWAVIRQGKVATFRTAMTGELYQLLAQHSLLAHSLEPCDDLDETVFLAGVKVARQGAGLLQLLFSVRTNHLLKTYTAQQSSVYLSGVLIGQDVASTLSSQLLPANARVAVVASATLAARYELALRSCGCQPVNIAGDEAVSKGIAEVASAAKFVDIKQGEFCVG